MLAVLDVLEAIRKTVAAGLPTEPPPPTAGLILAFRIACLGQCAPTH